MNEQTRTGKVTTSAFFAHVCKGPFLHTFAKGPCLFDEDRNTPRDDDAEHTLLGLWMARRWWARHGWVRS